MAKRETAQKLLNKLEASSKSTAPQYDKSERRRFALPQPDFAPYKGVNAYPGTTYFFVGHSYNVDVEVEADEQLLNKRKQAIKKVLQNANQKNNSVPISLALADESFYSILSRFERDWLRRLPDTSLIGPAIDAKGKRISQAFTVWRKEQRKAAAKSKEKESKEKEKEMVGALTR